VPKLVAVYTPVKCVELRSVFAVKCADCRNMSGMNYKVLKVKPVLMIRQEYLGSSEISLNCCYDTQRYDLEYD
jgi:hypothetical protein